MLSTGNSEHHNNYYNSRSKGFLMPLPARRTTWCLPPMSESEKKPRRSPQVKGDPFHVIHKSRLETLPMPKPNMILDCPCFN